MKRETNEERQREREGEERLRDERERDERESDERDSTTGFFLRLIFLPALFHTIRFTESDRFWEKEQKKIQAVSEVLRKLKKSLDEDAIRRLHNTPAALLGEDDLVLRRFFRKEQ